MSTVSERYAAQIRPMTMKDARTTLPKMQQSTLEAIQDVLATGAHNATEVMRTLQRIMTAHEDCPTALCMVMHFSKEIMEQLDDNDPATAMSVIVALAFAVFERDLPRISSENPTPTTINRIQEMLPEPERITALRTQGNN